jgi:hypothetical protein
VAGGEVVLAIADHGIGIPAGDLDRLFERYHRGSNFSGIVGTGVGLYLVKMALDMHGGRITVESREKEGSRFTISLPLQPAGAVEPEPTAATSTLIQAAAACRSVCHGATCFGAGERRRGPMLTGKSLASAFLALFVVAPAAQAMTVADAVVMRVDWQVPSQLPKRFRNHCAAENFTGRPYCTDHCGIDYQFHYCSPASFGCCHLGHGYCSWNGQLRCAP